MFYSIEYAFVCLWRIVPFRVNCFYGIYKCTNVRSYHFSRAQVTNTRSTHAIRMNQCLYRLCGLASPASASSSLLFALRANDKSDN